MQNVALPLKDIAAKALAQRRAEDAQRQREQDEDNRKYEEKTFRALLVSLIDDFPKDVPLDPKQDLEIDGMIFRAVHRHRSYGGQEMMLAIVAPCSRCGNEMESVVTSGWGQEFYTTIETLQDAGLAHDFCPKPETDEEAPAVAPVPKVKTYEEKFAESLCDLLQHYGFRQDE